jgi:hypothetical protein
MNRWHWPAPESTKAIGSIGLSERDRERPNTRFVAGIGVTLLAAPLVACSQQTGTPSDSQSAFHDSIRPPLGQKQEEPQSTFHDSIRPALEPKQESAREQPPLHLPVKVSECEAGQCGVWEFNGNGGTARWPSGAQATLTVEKFGFDGVTVRRNDYSGSTPGFVAVYSGKVIGNQLFGEVLWSWPGHWNHSPTGKWAGSVLEPANYNIIDPSIPCDSKYSISPAEAADRGVMAITGHDAQGGACWLRMAADAGNVPAQGMLAALDYKGMGVAVNLPEALDLARKAARQGSYLADRLLSLMYGNGEGVPKDPAKADYWRTKADQDKLAADRDTQQEQQQLAQQQQEARGFQAEQAQLQNRASVQPQVRPNLQDLALIALLLGNAGGSGTAGGNSRARLEQLESQLKEAQYECRQINPHGFESPACERVPGLEDDVEQARADLQR